MSVDSIAALNVSIEMGMSFADAYAFVRKNRPNFERLAGALVDDQSIADAARSIKAITSVNSSNAAKHPRMRRPRYLDETDRWRKEAYIALARNQRLTAPEIAGAIKAFGTMASVRYLRDWVRKNEAELRRKGAATAAKVLEKPRE